MHESNLIDVTNKLSSMNISNKYVKTKIINEVKNNVHKGPLDKFVTRKEIKEDSLTLSDFECDSVDLNLSDIVNTIIT